MADMLCLKWNNYLSNFSSVLSSIKENECYSDATVACEGQLYPVHKLVLCSCSDYFENIFQSIQCPQPTVVLIDTKRKDLEALLTYMYQGEVQVCQEDVGSLMHTAEALRIKGLGVADSIQPIKTQHESFENESFMGSEGSTEPPPSKKRKHNISGEEHSDITTMASPLKIKQETCSSSEASFNEFDDINESIDDASDTSEADTRSAMKLIALPNPSKIPKPRIQPQLVEPEYVPDDECGKHPFYITESNFADCTSPSTKGPITRKNRIQQYKIQCERLISFIQDGPLALRGLSNQEARKVRRQTKTHLWDESNQVLYYIGTGKQGFRKQVITSEDEILGILEHYHSSPMGGHGGITSTLRKISQYYIWNGIGEDVNEYVKSCDQCQRLETIQTTAPEMIPIKVAKPMVLVGMDLISTQDRLL